MTLPKVSVVIPVYGYSKYLRESIESVLNQTLKDIELIIVEDARNGRFENEATMEKYEHDSRVIHIKNENKEGFANSLNKGFSIAKANYIARLDADDISLPNRLLLQYNFLKESDCVVVGGNMIIIDENGEVKGYRRYPEIVTGKAMLLRDVIAEPAAVFDKKTILSEGGLLQEPVATYDLWMRLLDKGYKIYNLPDYVTKYRYHKGGGKYTSFKKIVRETMKLQIKAIRRYKNIGYNILFPIYFMAEIVFLILPARLGYFLFEKISVRRQPTGESALENGRKVKKLLTKSRKENL